MGSFVVAAASLPQVATRPLCCTCTAVPFRSFCFSIPGLFFRLSSVDRRDLCLATGEESLRGKAALLRRIVRESRGGDIGTLSLIGEGRVERGGQPLVPLAPAYMRNPGT